MHRPPATATMISLGRAARASHPRTRCTLRDLPVWRVAVSDDRSAALLLRVWLEDGDGQFRARLSSLARTRDEQEEELTVAVASSPRDVLTALSDWLDEFLAHAPDPIDGDD